LNQPSTHSFSSLRQGSTPCYRTIVQKANFDTKAKNLNLCHQMFFPGLQIRGGTTSSIMGGYKIVNSRAKRAKKFFCPPIRISWGGTRCL